MTDAPQFYVAHQTRGRIRLKAVGLKGQDDPLRSLAGVIGSLEGVISADARPATGSIVVVHNLTSAELLARAETASILDVIEEPEHLSAADEVYNLSAFIDAIMKSGSHGSLDLRSVGFLLFFFLGVIQLMRGNMSPPAATAFWEAANIVMAGKTKQS